MASTVTSASIEAPSVAPSAQIDGGLVWLYDDSIGFLESKIFRGADISDSDLFTIITDYMRLVSDQCSEVQAFRSMVRGAIKNHTGYVNEIILEGYDRLVAVLDTLLTSKEDTPLSDLYFSYFYEDGDDIN